MELLFFCGVLFFSYFYVTILKTLAREDGSWMQQLLFSLLWILPELLLFLFCKTTGSVTQLIPNYIFSFLALLLCFGICHITSSFEIEASASTLYLISIFLYMTIILNLSFTNTSFQSLFGICITSILFLFLYLISFLFHMKFKPSGIPMKKRNTTLPGFLLCLIFLLFTCTFVTPLSISLFLLIPKVYSYFSFARTKSNLFPQIFYDGMVRFYLIAIFDLLLQSGMVYHLVSRTTIFWTQGLLYLILLFYLYFIKKGTISKLTSLILMLGSLFLLCFPLVNL